MSVISIPSLALFNEISIAALKAKLIDLLLQSKSESDPEYARDDGST